MLFDRAEVAVADAENLVNREILGDVLLNDVQLSCTSRVVCSLGQMLPRVPPGRPLLALIHDGLYRDFTSQQTWLAPTGEWIGTGWPGGMPCLKAGPD